MNDPPDNPYAGMQTDPGDWQRKAMSRGKFFRFIVALGIIGVGGALILLGVLMGAYYELPRGLIRSAALLAGAGVFALAAAVYDGRLVSRRRKSATNVTETKCIE